MLVSSITRFSVSKAMNDASLVAMQNTSAINSAVNNSNTFAGEHSLTMLHELDKRNSLDLLTNKFLYKMASLQEKLASKQSKNDKSLNILA